MTPRQAMEGIAVAMADPSAPLGGTASWAVVEGQSFERGRRCNRVQYSDVALCLRTLVALRSGQGGAQRTEPLQRLR